MDRVRPWNLRHLEGVAAIRRTRSFSVAAGEISITQSALTQAVAALERRIGHALFDRQLRGARATAAGDLLADSIERAVHALNSVGNEVLSTGTRRVPLTRRATGTQLTALAAVERAGSFRGAARASGLTEASVHRAVRDLEASLGADLIIGSRTGIEATPAAIAIARATRQALAELDAAFEAAQHGSVRKLLIGAMPLVRAGLLPSAVAQLCRRDPHVRVHLVEGAYPELIAALVDGRLDMVLGALREDTPDGVVQQTLFDDQLVLVARHDHPLARTTGWSGTALSEFPWAASPAGTPRRARWEELLRASGAEPPLPRIECSSASAVRGLLLQGEWLAMLSPDQFRIERELGLLVSLGGPVPSSTRAIGIATRPNWIPDATQAAFLAVLYRCADEQSSAGLIGPITFLQER